MGNLSVYFYRKIKTQMASKKSDFLVCQECGMSGERGRFVEKEDPMCKQCTRVFCLEASLNEAHKRLETVTKTLDVVLERLNAVEGSRRQEEGKRQRWMGTARPRARTWKTRRKGFKRRRSRNKERQQPTKGRTGCCCLAIRL